MRYPPFLPALLCLVGITLLSVFPNPQLPKFNLISSDKLLHALAYGTQAWLLLWGWRRKTSSPVGGSARLSALAAAAAYGVLMEWVQYALVPSRFYEFDDMLANAAGAAIAAFFFPRK